MTASDIESRSSPPGKQTNIILNIESIAIQVNLGRVEGLALKPRIRRIQIESLTASNPSEHSVRLNMDSVGMNVGRDSPKPAIQQITRVLP